MQLTAIPDLPPADGYVILCASVREQVANNITPNPACVRRTCAVCGEGVWVSPYTLDLPEHRCHFVCGICGRTLALQPSHALPGTAEEAFAHIHRN